MSSDRPAGRKVVGLLPRYIKLLLVMQTVIIGFMVFWFGEEYQNNQYLQAYLNNAIAENGQAYVLLASMVVAILGAAAYARLKIQNMKAEQALRAELARQARETFALTKRRASPRPKRETLKRAEASSTLSETKPSVIRLREPMAGVGDERRFEDDSPRILPSEGTSPFPESETLAQPRILTEKQSRVGTPKPLARVVPLPRNVVARPLSGPSQDRGLAPLSGQAPPSGLNRVGPPPSIRPPRRVVPSPRVPVFREPGGPPPGLAGAPLTHRAVKQPVGTGPMDNPLPDNPLFPVRRVVSRQGLSRIASLRPVVPGTLKHGPVETSEASEMVEVSSVPKQESLEDGTALKRVPVAKRVDLDESEDRAASQQSG